MRIEIHQEENAMRSNAKGKRCSFITVVSVCFFLWAFVFPVPLYAVGEITAWGNNSYGQCNVPEPNINFAAIDTGSYHSLGLKQDCSIVAWGNNSYGQCNVPAPNTSFIAISAGNSHSLGLKRNGSVVAWGWNNYGQCNVPWPNTDFKAIAAGNGHSLGLKADGSIVAWGYNFWGECNVPLPNTGFTAIAAGVGLSLGLKTDGSIVAWGWTAHGQCNVPLPNTGFAAIAAGLAGGVGGAASGDHALGLKTDGSIVAWGQNTYGQCNVPEPNTGFMAIVAGGIHSMGLKSDGSIVAWGSNGAGQCTVPLPNAGFTAIAAGGIHSLGLKGNVMLSCLDPIPGDLDGDFQVNFDDFAIMASHWLERRYVRIVNFLLDINPNWTTEGQWQFGTPMGMGGSSHGYPDPNHGFTGQNVYGVNLNGDYDLAVGGPYRLTAGPFNCTGYEYVELNFARWLNTDISYYVKCTVEASNNGSDWQEIWSNPADTEIADNQWQQQNFDISSIADGQTAVYVRWSYQVLHDRAYPYSGWNIDDVELRGLTD